MRNIFRFLKDQGKDAALGYRRTEIRENDHLSVKWEVFILKELTCPSFHMIWIATLILHLTVFGGNSLGVQWLGLRVFNARPRFDPWSGTKISQAMWHDQNNNNNSITSLLRL